MRLLALLLLLAAASPALAQGTIRATTTQHPDGSRSVMIVDPDKMTAEETVSDAAGKTMRKVSYVLDEQNQPLGSIVYDAKGNIQYRASFVRDGAGRIAEENISSPQGQFLRKRVYTYGSQNKVTGMVEYDAQGNVIAQPRRVSAGRPDRKK